MGVVVATPYLLRLYNGKGNKAMKRIDVSSIIIIVLLIACVDWGKEAFKALIVGGIIGSWLTTKIR